METDFFFRIFENARERNLYVSIERSKDNAIEKPLHERACPNFWLVVYVIYYISKITKQTQLIS